ASLGVRTELEREIKASEQARDAMAREIQQMRERLAFLEGRTAATSPSAIAGPPIRAKGARARLALPRKRSINFRPPYVSARECFRVKAEVVAFLRGTGRSIVPNSLPENQVRRCQTVRAACRLACKTCQKSHRESERSKRSSCFRRCLPPVWCQR